MLCYAKSLQSCLTLSDPMDCSLPGSSIHGIFLAKVLEWGAIAFSEMMDSRYKRKSGTDGLMQDMPAKDLAILVLIINPFQR